MRNSLYVVAALAATLVPQVIASDPTDSYSDADPAQSGYLPNHNMDPNVVASAEFGQLWKIPFNNLEQVRLFNISCKTKGLEGLNSSLSRDLINIRRKILVLRETLGLYTTRGR